MGLEITSQVLSWLSLQLDVRPWTSQLTSWGLSIFVYKESN